MSFDRKEYQKIYQKARYEKNKQSIDSRIDSYKKARRKWFSEEIIAKSSCIKCGENHPGCLDFHHRDPNDKYMEVTKMVDAKCKEERILAEIAKCDILCANCHRKLHYEERNK